MTQSAKDCQATGDYYRYCPGEEHAKISNAICIGRRRTHFPKCTGCQFNDDEKVRVAIGASRTIVKDSPPSSPSPSPSEEEDQPVTRTRPAHVIEPLFHAADIGGTVPSPLSEDAAWRIGHATGQFLRAKLRGYDRVDPNARSIIVGRDSRQHSKTLETHLIEGIRSTGTDVMDLGLVDTPQLYFAVHHLGSCGGIHITAGHKPVMFNGFRICGAKAGPISMETGLASIRDIAVRVPRHQTASKSRLVAKDLSKTYTDFIREAMIAKIRLPRLFKIVVDASNGAAGKWLPIVLKGMRNLRMTRLNFEHKGEFAHEPNPMRARNMRELRQYVRDEEADFGVCFDSSAERAVFTDDRGRTVRPEFITALLARLFIDHEPGATIVYDHRSSLVTEEEIVRAGGISVRERIGGTHIKRAMSERDAVFGGDLSGRYYFRDNGYCESVLLAFVHVLNVLLKTERCLSELIRPLQRYSTSGELHYHCDDPAQAMNQLVDMHQGAEIEQFDGLTFRYPDWWFNVLPFPADRLLRVTLEARSRRFVDEKLAELEPILGEQR